VFFNKKKENKKKVLVVEDDALLARVLTDALKKGDLEVVNVMNGNDALESAKKFQPNIILLDLILPGLDGFGVLGQLKADEKTKNIPVAVISNLGDVGDVKSAKALGAEEYFIKANIELKKIVAYIKKRIKD